MADQERSAPKPTSPGSSVTGPAEAGVADLGGGGGEQALDRAALERVLARAAELQTGGGDAGDEFTERQILELGKEVGLSSQHLRQALAEERTRVALPLEAGGVASRLFGPAHVVASRVIRGNQDDALAAVDIWMQKQEWMVVKRHFPDRIVWEPRHDLLGALRRALNVGGRGYQLSRAFEVAATVVPVDDSRVLVRLDADFSTHRGSVAKQTAGGLVVGIASSAALAAMGFFSAVIAAPAVVITVASYSTARSLHVRAVGRAQLALEQLLDRLERGDLRRPPSLLSALAAAALPPKRG